MYTKRPIQPIGEPLRLPEHYSGVAFSRQSQNIQPSHEEKKEEENAKVPKEENEGKESTLPCTGKEDVQEKKHPSLLGIGGREDILLLILALLLLDDEGGDDILAYILLGLLFLG